MCTMWKATPWTVLDKEVQSSLKDSQKRDRKGNGKGTQKGGKFKGRNGVNLGKGKGRGKKRQRLNGIKEQPKKQWTRGSWEQCPVQCWSAEVDTASWRDDDLDTAAAAEEFQRASVGDFRHSN